MKIVFVYWGYENAGSMLDLRGYARAAKARIEAVRPEPKGFLPDAPARERPRVPFGALVERGVIRPGSVLRDPMGAHSACVLADGSLRTTAGTGRFVGSM